MVEAAGIKLVVEEGAQREVFRPWEEGEEGGRAEEAEEAEEVVRGEEQVEGPEVVHCGAE